VLVDSFSQNVCHDALREPRKARFTQSPSMALLCAGLARLLAGALRERTKIEFIVKYDDLIL